VCCPRLVSVATVCPFAPFGIRCYRLPLALHALDEAVPLISLTCHSAADRALISVAADDRPIQRRPINAAYQHWLLALNSSYMGGFSELAQMATTEALLPSAPIIGKLARAFVDGAAVTPTDRELAMLNAWIDAEFRQIPVPVRFTAADIDLPQMLATLRSTGELLISIAHNEHPFLEGFQNAKFRAVHDWHHVIIGADSSFAGEFATFEHAAQHAPSEIRWLLFSEIAMQAAACIATGRFQPQKLVRMPGL
jgi:hypothetical protein